MISVCSVVFLKCSLENQDAPAALYKLKTEDIFLPLRNSYFNSLSHKELKCRVYLPTELPDHKGMKDLDRHFSTATQRPPDMEKDVQHRCFRKVEMKPR